MPTPEVVGFGESSIDYVYVVPSLPGGSVSKWRSRPTSPPAAGR